MLLTVHRLDSAWEAVDEVLAGHHVTPEADPSLKALLPAITECFAAHLSVVDTIKALKEHEHSDDSSGKLSSYSRRRSRQSMLPQSIVIEGDRSVFIIIECRV